MVRLNTWTFLVFAVLLGGCSPKAKEVSKAAHAEAAQHASEADFATQIRDYARAEAALRQAVKLDPAISEYWLQLGFACRRQNNLDDARAAYKKALALREDLYRKEKSPEHALDQLEVLALLGRADDARKLLERIRRDYGSEYVVKTYVEQQVLEQMIANPAFKALAL